MAEPAEPGRVVFNIEMVLGEHTLEASARVPDGMLRLADLLPIIGAEAVQFAELGRVISPER